MPPATHRRLTEADYLRITAYHAQQYATADIAQELACSIPQVQRALRHLGLNRGFKHSRTKPSTVLIRWEQYQLTKWYEERGLPSQYLAAQLGHVSWLILEQELRGTRRMTARRISALLAVVRELDPWAELPATLST